MNELSPTISLDGMWEFSLGDSCNWLPIKVPGCWEAQGFSKFLEGPAFYRRKIHIPREWEGYPHIILSFRAVSYACVVYLDKTIVGEHRGLWTPFSIEITPYVQPGSDHLLEIEVYKPGQRYPMRSCLAGFLPDIATTFGGIWQSVHLRASYLEIADLSIVSDPDTGQLRIHCQVDGEILPTTDRMWRLKVFFQGELLQQRELPLLDGSSLDTILTVITPELWCPASPVLYKVQVEIIEQQGRCTAISQSVGFRKLSAKGERLFFNGKPACLRGTLSWGWDPNLIAPSFSEDQIRQVFQKLRSLGFNMVKLCLFVPNQLYYDVADQEGMLIWQEWPMWLPHVTQQFRIHAPQEYQEMMKLTRHHPSIILYSLGCELNRDVDSDLLTSLHAIVRHEAPDTLICDNSGSGESYGGLSLDLSDFIDYHPYFDLHYLEPLLDNWNRDWQPKRPWIFGEFCDSDGFRDLEEIIRENNGQIPWWLTRDNPITTWRPEARALVEEKERLQDAGVADKTSDLISIATAQSRVVRKFTLETIRRRDVISGYVITGLRDTPIATSGVLDDFLRPKWPPEAFTAFNQDAILCLDIGRRRNWQYGGDRPDRLDIYNHWSGQFVRWHVILNDADRRFTAKARFNWQLIDPDGVVYHQGGSCFNRGKRDSPKEVSVVECTLPGLEHAQEYLLKVSLLSRNGSIQNQWPIWIYPQPVKWPDNLCVYDPSHSLDFLTGLDQFWRFIQPGDPISEKTVIMTAQWDIWLMGLLKAGHRILLLQQGDGPFPARRAPFWREAIKIFHDHPIWRDFPQKGYTDLQFFGLASDVLLESNRFLQFCPELESTQPLLRRLDAREFHITDYLVDSCLGSGRMLICSLRLQGSNGYQPSGLQRNVAGLYLLWLMISYLQV